MLASSLKLPALPAVPDNPPGRPDREPESSVGPTVAVAQAAACVPSFPAARADSAGSFDFEPDAWSRQLAVKAEGAANALSALQEHAQAAARAAATMAAEAALLKQRARDTDAQRLAERSDLQARLDGTAAGLRLAAARCSELESYERLYHEERKRREAAEAQAAELRERVGALQQRAESLEAASIAHARCAQRLAQARGTRVAQDRCTRMLLPSYTRVPASWLPVSYAGTLAQVCRGTSLPTASWCRRWWPSATRRRTWRRWLRGARPPA